ncbi:MAG: DUF362 domain-containing protein [Candidatus Thorarchaeota archaeon]
MTFTSYVSVAVRKTQSDALRTAISKLPNPVPISPSTKNIIIKPSIYDPNLPGNTSFGMVKAVVEFFKAVAPIYLVESDNPIRTAEEAFNGCNYSAFVKEGVKVVNLSKEALKASELPGHFLKTIQLPCILLENEFLVNLATVKPQERIGIGAGIKNLFGLLPEKDKAKWHNHLSDVLVDLLTFFKPKLNIIDLTYLIEGDRADPKIHQVGGIIIGTDAVAVDAYCAHILGFDPMKIDYIRKAYDLGLGEALPERIQVFGTDHQKDQLVDLCSI